MQDRDRDGNGHFTTRNTALAAYLRTKGFTLLDVEVGDHYTPAVFVFEKHYKLVEFEKNWQLGKATGNLTDFFESYRLCLRMVRVGKL